VHCSARVFTWVSLSSLPFSAAAFPSCFGCVWWGEEPLGCVCVGGGGVERGVGGGGGGQVRVEAGCVCGGGAGKACCSWGRRKR
jgi:hypothetical protein